MSGTSATSGATATATNDQKGKGKVVEEQQHHDTSMSEGESSDEEVVEEVCGSLYFVPNTLANWNRQEPVHGKICLYSTL